MRRRPVIGGDQPVLRCRRLRPSSCESPCRVECSVIDSSLHGEVERGGDERAATARCRSTASMTAPSWSSGALRRTKGCQMCSMNIATNASSDRYEYTIIGDAVSEAARLIDLAKPKRGRVVVSRAALLAASPKELRHRMPDTTGSLRGSAPTPKHSCAASSDARPSARKGRRQTRGSTRGSQGFACLDVGPNLRRTGHAVTTLSHW